MTCFRKEFWHFEMIHGKSKLPTATEASNSMESDFCNWDFLLLAISLLQVQADSRNSIAQLFRTILDLAKMWRVNKTQSHNLHLLILATVIKSFGKQQKQICRRTKAECLGKIKNFIVNKISKVNSQTKQNYLL